MNKDQPEYRRHEVRLKQAVPDFERTAELALWYVDGYLEAVKEQYGDQVPELATIVTADTRKVRAGIALLFQKHESNQGKTVGELLEFGNETDQQELNAHYRCETSPGVTAFTFNIGLDVTARAREAMCQTIAIEYLEYRLPEEESEPVKEKLLAELRNAKQKPPITKEVREATEAYAWLALELGRDLWYRKANRDKFTS